jgi:copper ion binding protein
MSVTTEYIVSGMHCQHCVSSVTEEVSAIPGVTDVRVDLDTGELVVTSDTDLFFSDIEAAIDEAGYTVAVS